MKKQKKLVHGVGINDADYLTRKHEIINSNRKEVWTCPFYRAWKGMITRCYSSSFHAKQPTYVGCAVTPKWHRFSLFREWMITQPWEGNELDKDILIPGNKLYSPETCVFVSRPLNMFLVDRSASRGNLPIGVSINRGMYGARCNNPFTGKYDFLGRFDTPSEAHQAWRKRKHELACQWADTQNDPRIAKALRERFA